MNEIRLDGFRLLNTRPAGVNHDLSVLVRSRGGESIELPAIEIRFPQSYSSEFQRIGVPSADDLLVVTSPNGALALQRIVTEGVLGSTPLNVAAIGSGTAERLNPLHPFLNSGVPCLVSSGENGGVLAHDIDRWLRARTEHTRARVVLFRGDRARDELPQTLTQLGHTVESVVVYHSALPDVDDTARAVCAALRGSAPKLDAIFFTSPVGIANVDLLMSQIDPSQQWLGLLRTTPVVTVGGTTADGAERAGYARVTRSDSPSNGSMIAAVAEVLTHTGPSKE